jgi:hypothetical protein
MPGFEMLVNVNIYTLSSLQCRPSLVSLPTTHTRCADVSTQLLGGAQPNVISTALKGPLQVLKFEMTSNT